MEAGKGELKPPRNRVGDLRGLSLMSTGCTNRAEGQKIPSVEVYLPMNSFRTPLLKGDALTSSNGSTEVERIR